MSTTVNPRLIKEIKQYGAFDVSACFNCGNCTAVCPLATQHGAFPRRLIRLGMIGDRQRLIASPEPWLCYYCGECSDTCPRQAEPGEYMAALRRYAIASAEPTGLASKMYRSVGVSSIVFLLLFVLLGAFLATSHMGTPPPSWLFHTVSYQAIHVLGLVVMAACLLVLLTGIAQTYGRMMRDQGTASKADKLAALKKTMTEVVTMSRHLEPDTDMARLPWYKRAGWIHIGIMGGFFGLLAATTLDFIFLELLPLHLSVFWPARILGTLAGAAMLWGVSAAILRRLTGAEKSVSYSFAADWWFLIFLFVLAVTGFWLEVAVTFGLVSPTNDMVLIVHAAMAMELVLMAAFTKLAHVFYRPIALYAYYLREARAAEEN